MVDSIAFPVSALWAAARLARDRGDDGLVGELVALLEASVKEPVQRALLDPARNGTPGAVLPFRGDALDVLGLAAWLSTHTTGSGRGTRADRRYYSQLSAVEAGYFEIRGSRGTTVYVDRTGQRTALTRADRHRLANASPPRPVEVLAPDAISSALEALRRIEVSPARVSIPEEGDALLEIQWGKGSLLVPRRKEVPIEFSLVRRDGASRALVTRRMPGLLLRARSRQVWGVIAPPERVMEVHAAAMAGQGFQIGYGTEQACVIATIDFTAVGPQGLARCSTGALLDPVFGTFSGEPEHIRVPLELARRLTAVYRWLTPASLADLLVLVDPSASPSPVSPTS